MGWKDPKNYIIRGMTKQADLPQLPDNCTLEVFFVKRVIEAAYPWSMFIQAIHAGLAFNASSCTSHKPLMALHYYVDNFPFGPFIPDMTDDAMIWQSDASVALTTYQPTDWDQIIPVGTISGAQWQKLSDWIPGWWSLHRQYQLLQVQSDIEESKAEVYLNMSDCMTFVEDGLAFLTELGARFGTQQPVYKSGCYLAALSPPRPVDMADKTAANAVRAYYLGLSDLCKGQTRPAGANVSAQLTFPRNKEAPPRFDVSATWFASNLTKFIQSPFVYVYDPWEDLYWQVEPHPEWVKLMLTHMVQRWVVPWR
jgi:hypothetical protein